MCDHFVSVVRTTSGFKVHLVSRDQMIEYIIPTDFTLTPEMYLNLITLGVRLQLNLILCAVTTFTVLQISKL